MLSDDEQTAAEDAFLGWTRVTRPGDQSKGDAFLAGWEAAMRKITSPPASGWYLITVRHHDGGWDKRQAVAHELAKFLTDLAGNLAYLMGAGERYTIERLPGPVLLPDPGFGSYADEAAKYLEGEFAVLAKSWSCPEGGLSVIAAGDGALVLVYTKLASENGSFHGPLETLAPGTAEEMFKLGRTWLAQRKVPAPPLLRIDVIGLTRQPDGLIIEHVRNVASEAG